MMRYLLLAPVLLSLAAPNALAAERKLAASGATQVVAKIHDREVTLSDIRIEMARLGLQPNTPDADRIALESVVDRILLNDAARDANLHRSPDAMRQMAAASERALADAYVAFASQPPEPTVAEIEDFITANPLIFADRVVYEFLVLTMPTDKFDGEKQTPLFDESADFAEYSSFLRKSGVEYRIAPAVQPSNAFPETIRNQLSVYGLNDNIVIQGPAETQIMKITGRRRAPLDGDTALTTARRALLAERTEERRLALMESLRRKAAVAYFRDEIAPLKGARK